MQSNDKGFQCGVAFIRSHNTQLQGLDTCQKGNGFSRPQLHEDRDANEEVGGVHVSL
jgi:hypothetical protein